MDKKIAFLGTGNMASAIINGITAPDSAAHVDESRIVLYDIDQSKYAPYQNRSFILASSPVEAATIADYIVLAVKPQNYQTLLLELKRGVNSLSGKVFVSLAAGISTASIADTLGQDVAIVRTMPNTPLLAGYGVTALCRNDKVSDDDFNRIRGIFDSRGMTALLPESDMNKIISATSSAPAYVYTFIKAIYDGASAQGLENEALLEMICRTVIGSAEMVLRSKMPLDELIRMVTSPKGTTERALEVLNSHDFSDIIALAMKKCTERADELSKEL
ncbi:MAG: pyrroline-5-carboxylate reductase [Clostridiales bacterium]|nr:pyrroline-5-carboxylate reductase [Clostridiales bacterium]